MIDSNTPATTKAGGMLRQASAISAVSLTGLAVAISLALAFAPPMAHAQEAAAQISIGQESLSDALLQLGQQTSLQFIYTSELVRGLAAKPVRGRMTAEQALRRLLEGTGIEYSRSGNTIDLWKATDTAQLAPVLVKGSSLVATEGTGSYTTGITSAAIGMNLSLRQTPQSVTVITSQQIRDRGFSSISEALENTTGLYTNNDFARPSFVSRGFSVTNFNVDGSPMQPSSRALSSLQMTNTVAYDRITVVRGANGLLTGTGEPSASVNLVRKRATRDFQGYVSASAGSWNNYGLEADVSNSLNASGSIRGRIAVGGSDGVHFIDHKGSNVRTLFATLEADLTSRTVGRVGYHLDNTEIEGMTALSSVPLFYSDGSLIDLPVSWGNTPRVWSQKQQASTAFVGLEHDFENGWQLDGEVNYTKNKRISKQVIKLSSVGNYPNPDGSWGMSLYSYTPTPIQDEQVSYNLNLSGPVHLFGREHELIASLAGWKRERKWYEVELDDFTLPDGFMDAGLWDMADRGFEVGWRRLNPSFVTHTEQHAGLLAARWNLSDTVKVFTGGRLTSWKTRVENYDAKTGQHRATGSNYKISNELTPYAGITWDFHPNLTAYASYADVFRPQEYFDSSDSLLEPVVGRSYEIGLKGEFFDRRLNASVGLFRTLQANLAVIDPRYPDDYLTPGGNRPYISAGKGNVSKGIDLEIAGALTDRWNIVGGYVYANVKDGDGNRLEANNPEHVLRLFTAYRMNGFLEGLTVGGGVNWHSAIESSMKRPTGAYDTSGAPVTQSYTFKQPSVFLVNAMLRYDATKNLSISLNVDNLLDKKYFNSFSSGTSHGVYGSPRRIRAGLRYQF